MLMMKHCSVVGKLITNIFERGPGNKRQAMIKNTL